ncbi:MAG TPA: ARMT1-like domain-containing protein [Syntrophorhabdales bacterium]|nr:ARMT1-like domain-containing protein [Syntrophorhabdales bacterium]
MHIWPDCIPCIEKMALGLGRLALKDEARVRRFMTDVMKLPPLRGENWDVISPRVLREVWRMLLDYAGDRDPMREVKAEQNRRAMEIYPLAKKLVLKSPDVFLTALKLAIAGNELDAMVSVTEDGAIGMLKKLDSFTLDVKSAEEFRRRLKRAKTIAYFIDNCGEIVFDKLFIETLKSMKKFDIAVVTRTVPILNDATLQDAQSVGLQEVARLVENGIQEAIAGTLVSEVSSEVKNLIDKADLLISKGVGNYDAFTEETWLRGRLTMLYHGKCHPCCSATGARMGDLVVYNF